MSNVSLSFHNVVGLRLGEVRRHETDGEVHYSRVVRLDYEDGTQQIVLFHGKTPEAVTLEGEPKADEWRPKFRKGDKLVVDPAYKGNNNRLFEEGVTYVAADNSYYRNGSEYVKIEGRGENQDGGWSVSRFKKAGDGLNELLTQDFGGEG